MESERGMNVKAVSGIMLTLLLISMLALASNVQQAKAEPGTITIKADGSVDPPTANITSTDNVTYYFTGNNYDAIVVERSNIVVDGNGSTLKGSGSGYGFNLTNVNNVTIQNTLIENFDMGVYLEGSSNNTFSGNNITNSTWAGVFLYHSDENTVSGNTITNNYGDGVDLDYSDNNTVSGNKITNNYYGVVLWESDDNTFSGNKITNNGDGVVLEFSFDNTFSGNNITNNYYGVLLDYSGRNTVSGNNITNNEYGIYFYESVDNKFYHNSFIDNTQQVNITVSGYANFWNDSYPSGGNYWSNYTGVDLNCGPYQNQTGSDGIGDTPHILDENNIDYYPLMNPWIEVCGVNITGIAFSQCGVSVDAGYTTWNHLHPLEVDVTVHNNGTGFIDCTVSAYYQDGATWVQIGTSQAITGLDPCNTATKTFSWDLTGLTQCTSYTVKANVSCTCVASDTDTTTIYIRLTGDVDDQDDVDIIDVGKVAMTFALGSYNVMHDIDGDCDVDIIDLGKVAMQFALGATCP